MAAPPIVGNEGICAPRAIAMIRFVAPAVSPLTIAIHDASDSDTFRVRLLSTPHAMHAPRTSSGAVQPDHSTNPGQLMSAAPATMHAKPTKIRASTFSRKTIHAMTAVNTASALSRSDADDAA